MRNRQFLGLKFIRQHPISYKSENKSKIFVADFYCHEAKLVIEIDGPIHDVQEEKGTIKDLVLKEKWLIIYRYKNREIEHELSIILNTLQLRLNGRFQVGMIVFHVCSNKCKLEESWNGSLLVGKRQLLVARGLLLLSRMG